MRILHVQKIKAYAGSEKYIVDIIIELEKRGVSCLFLCVVEKNKINNLERLWETLEKNNIQHRIITFNKFNSYLNIININKFLKKEHFDIIHSHLIHADFWIACQKVLFAYKGKIVSTIHGYDENYLSNYGLVHNKKVISIYYLLCKFSLSKFNKCFAVSYGLKNLFVEIGIINNDKVSVIHHGIASTPKINHKNRIPNKIIVPGRVVKYKGQYLLEKIIPNLIEQLPDLKIYFAGEIQDKNGEFLKKKLTHLYPNHIFFLGHISNLKDYLNTSSLAIVPSISEGFGLVVLECMNHGVPVITFNVPAFNEIIEHEKNGVLIPRYNIEELEDTVLKLLNSEKQRVDISIKAKNILEKKFSKENMITSLVQFYYSV